MRPTAVPETTVIFVTRESTGQGGPAATAEPDIVATIVAGSQPRLYAAYPSPDGTLRAEVLIHDCAEYIVGQENAYELLRVVDTATGATQTLDSQLQYCGGLGAAGLQGWFWSPSGRFFYYTTARDGVPDGCGYWTRPYSRADLTEGSAEYLGGGALSLDSTQLAVWSGPELVVYDVDGAAIGSVRAAVPNTAVGPTVWSPDGSALAYLQAGAFCIPGAAGQTSVVLVDVPSLVSRVLISSDTPAFQDVAWYGSDRLLLADDTGQRWSLDVASGELTQGP